MLRAISLYAGIGGLDFGFEAAGFDTAVALEQDAACCKALRLNRSWPVLEGDINTFSSRKIMGAGSLKKGEADILIGGPPCQPFSKSSNWARSEACRLDDPRADTLTAFLRVLRDAKPKAFLLENVKGLVQRGREAVLRQIMDGVSEINAVAKTNYKIHWQVHNAVDYGVPQLRERVFLVASRDGRPFVFPESSHGEGRGERYRNTWDAIGDLPARREDSSLALSGKWAKLLKSIPEGKNYLWHTSRGGGSPLFGWRARYWNFLLKLAKSCPSWTIQASPGPSTGPFHWKNRLLCGRELARLQTFPADVEFGTDRLYEVQRMTGNAVPSLLAEVLASEIRRQLLDCPRRRRQMKLAVPDRGRPPRAERVRSLDKSFEHLVGDYPDHAGEGRGPQPVLQG